MEGYVVSALKYRPGTFDSVVGQRHVTDTLKNALRLDELAHSFLFSGPRGVGKTTCARILAKAINCLNPENGEPCNTCQSCDSFNHGKSLNIHELDAASNNGVEDIRKIIEQVRYVPASGKKSVFIIDEVHMLSQAAFNAFLKTLEEPPPHAIFILATTEKHKILPTILSRCQKFDFRRIGVNAIADHLKEICGKENYEYEFEALQLIGLKADGALRDALSIFDQLASFSGKKITYKVVLENLNILDYEYFFRVTDLIKNQDHPNLLLLLDEVIHLGFEMREFVSGLNEHFRNLLVAQDPNTVKLLETSDNIKQKYIQTSKSLQGSILLNAFNLCSQADQSIKTTANPRLLAELLLLKLAYIQNAIQISKDSTDSVKKKPRLEEKEVKTEEKDNSLASNKGEPEKLPRQEKTETSPKKEEQKKEEPKVKEVENKEKTTKTPKKSFASIIPNSLDLLEVPEEDKSKKTEDDYSDLQKIHPDISIEKEVFEKALKTIVDQARELNQQTLASAFQLSRYTLEHNKWTQKVANFIQKKKIETTPEFLTEMRELIGVPSLFLEVIVEDIENPKDNLPYSTEEKLAFLEKKNPNIRSLMKRFDTLVKY